MQSLLPLNDQEIINRARAAKEIVDSPLWAECWSVYRAKLIDIIDKADSNNAELVMHAKRLMAASKTAQGHLTMILQDGAISAAQIKLDEEREKKKWWQVAA